MNVLMFQTVYFDLSIFTREYAKRNERVIGMDGKFTHSLAHSIHHTDVNFFSISTLK